MWEVIQSGGILMAPIILCSILALAISAERFGLCVAAKSPCGHAKQSMGLDEKQTARQQPFA